MNIYPYIQEIITICFCLIAILFNIYSQIFRGRQDTAIVTIIFLVVSFGVDEAGGPGSRADSNGVYWSDG